MPHRLLLSFFCLLVLSTPLLATDPVKIRKVVIDAGHGGQDPGAISPNRKVLEKDITLSVALKFGKLIEDKNPDIQVIYTRKTDVFVPLNNRSEIANKNQADLFISIHVNSVKARSACGSETYVMGESKSSSNLEVTMMENSVIAFEGDSKSVYEGFDPNNPESYIIFSLLQNAHLEKSLQMAEYVQEQLAEGPIKVNRGIKQGGLLVLWKTSMPAILVELGFISNPSDYLMLCGEENHMKYAKALYKAFEKYRKAYEAGNRTSISNPTATATATATTTTTSSAAAIPSIQDSSRDTATKNTASTKTTTSDKTSSKSSTSSISYPYRIQILAVTKKLPDNAPDLKGEKNVNCIKVGNYFKYSIGEFKTREEAMKELPNVKIKFPQAFITKVENEN